MGYPRVVTKVPKGYVGPWGQRDNILEKESFDAQGRSLRTFYELFGLLKIQGRLFLTSDSDYSKGERKDYILSESNKHAQIKKGPPNKE